MRRYISRRTPIDDIYETCERTFAQLQIYTDNIEPNAITEQLGIPPSRSQKKGDVLTNSSGVERIPKINGWFLSSEPWVASKDVRRHLDWLLSQLVPIKERLLALQDMETVRMVVKCIWWSAYGDGGPTLWPEQMQLLADLNLECSFSLAFFGVEEDEKTTGT